MIDRSDDMTLDNTAGALAPVFSPLRRLHPSTALERSRNVLWSEASDHWPQPAPSGLLGTLAERPPPAEG